MLPRTIIAPTDFYPRSPCGERPRPPGLLHSWRCYFYPRSPCGERPARPRNNPVGGDISIHALLAESDVVNVCGSLARSVISIHALLAESDQQKCGDGKPHVNFYPRSPCGERHFENMVQTYLQNFYPRSPCGERLLRPSPVSVIARFLSTLSLRRATNDILSAINNMKFLSTLSLRRATNIPLPNAHIIAISIHALLAESDCCRPRWPPQAQKFLSTLSLRRATMGSVSRYLLPRDFYPRSPCGERHSRHCPQKVILYFYPRSPCGERHMYQYESCE